MHVLVTGGAGFIGSHLSEALLGRGETVTVLDDLSTGSEENLAAVRDDDRLELVVGSVLDRPLVTRLVSSADSVVHLASPVGVGLIVDDPLGSMHTIIHGTESVLDAAIGHHTKVLVASTSEVYGKNPARLDEEADHVLGATSVPRWVYATAKAIDEYLALGYWKVHRVPTVVLRFFNTVGPRQTGAYGMVLPRFVSQALLGEDLTVYGDGTQRRCFCHVDDTVRAVLSLHDDVRAVGGVYNVASDEEIAIGDLARRVIEHTGSASGIRQVTFEDRYGTHFEDVDRRRPDTTRIRALTGWTPRFRLDDTIDAIVTSVGAIGPRVVLPEAA
jgi:nucleoside-diphosphate-sugar epimerase